jgi:hypothetical protein
MKKVIEMVGLKAERTVAQSVERKAEKRVVVLEFEWVD